MLRPSWKVLREGCLPAARVLEPAGRVSETAVRASELAERALEPNERALEITGRALEPAGRPGATLEGQLGGLRGMQKKKSGAILVCGGTIGHCPLWGHCSKTRKTTTITTTTTILGTTTTTALMTKATIND